MIIQGRQINERDIRQIQELLRANPSRNRTWLSRELCQLWNWRNPKGLIKDMACRSLLLKLEQQGQIILPKPQTPGCSPRKQIADVPHSTDPVSGTIKDLAPVTVEPVSNRHLKLFRYLLARYHYLGFGRPVGQNLKYMAFDKNGTPLSCLLFGSAAWKCAPRDQFIGWSHQAREINVNLVTNNTRFLILPWVRVPHLASHVLGHTARRIGRDWEDKYGHRVYLLETFVEKKRFAGTCYRAAGWIQVGQTTGRSRNDRRHSLKVPIKSIYLYPLANNFREVLSRES